MAGCGLIRRFLPLRGSRFADLDPRLERRPGEQLILKKYASAFFGTHLASTLTSQGIDTYRLHYERLCTRVGCGCNPIRFPPDCRQRSSWRPVESCP